MQHATFVIQVMATDSNCGTNSIVTYSLSAGGVVPPPQFAIEERSGLITLATKLDYESSQLHEFPVMAIDRGEEAYLVGGLQAILESAVP